MSETMKTPALLSLSLVLVACLLAVPAQAAFLASYSFDAGTAEDESGNGNDGIISGDPVPEDAISGLGFAFDGDDRIRVPADPTLGSQVVTFSLWLLVEELPAAPVVFFQKMAAGQGYSLVLTPTGAVRFQIQESPGNGAFLASSFPLVPGVWTSVVASHDGEELRLFLHGEAAGTRPAGDLAVDNDAGFVLARDFSGLLDELKISNTPADAEVACREAFKRWHEESGSCNSTVLDVTAELGLTDVTHKAFGATLVDVNEDGWIDLYVVNGGVDPDVDQPDTGICPELDGVPDFDPSTVNTFFMNNGDGTFSEDMAPELGLDDFWNAMRHVWADYDEDGLRDVYSHNFILSSLYKAVAGPDPMLFEDVSEAANLRVCLRRGTGASWADIDNDGDLDITLVEYDALRPASEHLYVVAVNNGDGTFTDVTAEVGISEPNNPMGIAFADYDNDGDQDVFFTNSHDAPSRLYRNEGVQMDTGLPLFVDVGAEAGVAVIGEPNRGVGVGWGDYDNDGFLDLLFSREADSRLWRNDGDGTFTDVTGVGGLDLNQGGPAFWGGNFADLDNDGWLDVLLTNRGFPGGANKLYMNNGDGTWREVADLLGVSFPTLPGLGVAPGDIDNDGDLDLFLVTHDVEQSNVLLRNETRGNNWIQLRLTGTLSNRDAVGAKIFLQTELEPGGQPVRQMREISAGTGFFVDMPRIQTFGVGKASTVRNVRILWPSGQVQNLGALPVNQRHDVVEPES